LETSDEKTAEELEVERPREKVKGWIPIAALLGVAGRQATLEFVRI